MAGEDISDKPSELSFNPKKGVWTEAYRPSKVSSMVLDKETKETILSYLEKPMAMPNFLFFSKSPGTGKTTLAKAIINETGCDSITINSSDDRGIESVREKVKQFCLTQSSKQGLKRCVFLDEVDGMLKPAQDALRNMMETYESNVFFILTANNIHRVIEALQSRCRRISFAFPNKDAVVDYLEGICKNENIDYSIEGLVKLVDLNYPSIRDCVNVLQDLYTSKKPVLPNTVKPLNAVFDDVWDLIKKKDFEALREIILGGVLEPRALNDHLWNRAYMESDARMIQITCKNEIEFARGANPKIIFGTSIQEMIK